MSKRWACLLLGIRDVAKDTVGQAFVILKYGQVSRLLTLG